MQTWVDLGRYPQVGAPLSLCLVSEGEYLAIGEAAALIGVSTDTLRRWERSGRITAVRTPTGHRRFKRSDIEALLRNGSH